MTAVTRVNGSSRDPYPPTTVSLLTKPRSDFKSASTTRIGHLNLTRDCTRARASGVDRGTAWRPGKECCFGGKTIERMAQHAERSERRRRAFVGFEVRSRRVVLN